MVRLGELMMILELHRQGVSITAIARRTGRDPKTIRKYIERGVEAPAYGPRCVGRPSILAPYLDFLRERLIAFPELSAARLTREIRELGYAGAYTAVKRYLAAIRPDSGPRPYEVRFETPPGVQAQVDFARFVVDFADDPGNSRIVWLFSLVLGHSRLLFARYEGVLREKIRFLCRSSLLVVDEIGYLPVTPGGGNLFFQLVNARYEKGAMILTSNRGFAEWGDVFGDPVVATALLDRLLHHAVVVQIEGSSYRMRQHADLLPEHSRSSSPINPPPPPKRRGRPPSKAPSDHAYG